MGTFGIFAIVATIILLGYYVVIITLDCHKESRKEKKRRCGNHPYYGAGSSGKLWKKKSLWMLMRIVSCMEQTLWMNNLQVKKAILIQRTPLRKLR